MSSIITTIVESFLPSAKEKYVYHQCKQLSSHRPYKQSIPAYLHDRPHNVIVHCLDRKVKSSGFTGTSVHDIDHDKGVFEVEKLSGTRYKVDFGSETGEPSCTCKDWIRYHIFSWYFSTVKIGSYFQKTAETALSKLLLDQLCIYSFTLQVFYCFFLLSICSCACMYRCMQDSEGDQSRMTDGTSPVNK